MSKLFVTGDTHGGIDMTKLNSRHFRTEGLTKDDIMVIMGDAGFIWNGGGADKFWQDFLNDKPWTTFCVLGNHENYDLIEQLPVVDFRGAKAYKVNDSLYYAITGEVYEFCGKKCLVVNGADSHDLYNPDGTLYRTPHKSWWEQERITQDDINKALISLAQHGDEVDFIFSHTGGTEVNRMLGFKPTHSDFMLDLVLNTADYDQHFCGHYHVDKLCDKSRILYDDILLIASSDEDD